MTWLIALDFCWLCQKQASCQICTLLVLTTRTLHGSWLFLAPTEHGDLALPRTVISVHTVTLYTVKADDTTSKKAEKWKHTLSICGSNVELLTYCSRDLAFVFLVPPRKKKLFWFVSNQKIWRTKYNSINTNKRTFLLITSSSARVVFGQLLFYFVLLYFSWFLLLPEHDERIARSL